MFIKSKADFEKFPKMKPLRYTLNITQWAHVVAAVDNKEDGYEIYKRYVNSAPVNRNPALFYTKEEFDDALETHRIWLSEIKDVPTFKY